MTQSQAETETLNNHNPTHSDSGHNLINSASDGSETCQNVFQKSSMAFINGSEGEEVIKIEDDHDPGNILDSSRNSNNNNEINENNKILRRDYNQSSNKQFHPKRLLGLFPAIFFFYLANRLSNAIAPKNLPILKDEINKTDWNNICVSLCHASIVGSLCFYIMLNKNARINNFNVLWTKEPWKRQIKLANVCFTVSLGYFLWDTIDLWNYPTLFTNFVAGHHAVSILALLFLLLQNNYNYLGVTALCFEIHSVFYHGRNLFRILKIHEQIGGSDQQQQQQQQENFYEYSDFAYSAFKFVRALNYIMYLPFRFGINYLLCRGTLFLWTKYSKSDRPRLLARIWFTFLASAFLFINCFNMRKMLKDDFDISILGA